MNGRPDLGDSIGVMETHGLEERGGFRLGGVGSQVESAQHGQCAARVAIRGGSDLCNYQSGNRNAGQTDTVFAVNCTNVEKDATDLEGSAPRTNRGAAACILCEAQQTRGGIQLSPCRIWPQNLHTAPCNSLVQDHRSPP